MGRPGPDGLADRRKATDGGQAKLTPAQRAELFAAPQRPPPDGGLWAGPKVAAFTLRVPGPTHPEAATPAERRAWGRCPGRAGRRPAPR